MKRTTYLEVETFVAKTEKQKDFLPLWKRFLKFAKAHPELFKFKSAKIYTTMIGGTMNSYVMMFEYATLTDWEQEHEKITKNKEFGNMLQEYTQITLPGTITMNMLASAK